MNIEKTNNQKNELTTEGQVSELGDIARTGEIQITDSDTLIYSIIDDLKECGLTIDQDIAYSVFDDPNLYDRNFSELNETLGIQIPDEESKAIRQKAIDLGVLTKINQLAGKSLQEALTKIDVSQIEIIGGYIDGVDPVEALISIIEDKDTIFSQGYHWNVLISSNQPVVFKFTKYGEHHFASADQDQERLPEIEEVFDRVFLLRHVQMQLEQTNRRILLQEKLDPGEWSSLSTNQDLSVEQIIEIANSSQNNRELLARFLDQVKQLDNDKGLVIDAMGQNIWFRKNKQGDLEIKLIDYGVFSEADAQKHKQVSDNISKVRQFIDDIHIALNR